MAGLHLVLAALQSTLPPPPPQSEHPHPISNGLVAAVELGLCQGRQYRRAIASDLAGRVGQIPSSFPLGGGSIPSQGQCGRLGCWCVGCDLDHENPCHRRIDCWLVRQSSSHTRRHGCYRSSPPLLFRWPSRLLRARSREAQRGSRAPRPNHEVRETRAETQWPMQNEPSAMNSGRPK